MMRAFTWTVMIMAVVGALNCGLIGIFGFDFIAALLGRSGEPTAAQLAPVSRFVYACIGFGGALHFIISLALYGQFRGPEYPRTPPFVSR
jgi:uncharacterized membrane protein YuzA (DUF378 family)